jgi:competence protein ComEA
MDRSLLTAGSISLAAVALALIAWPASPEAPAIEIVSARADRIVTVHVSGAVARPGLVTLPSDARVADAIVAAGGATDDAELGTLNLAATVGDGTLLVVPSLEIGGPVAGDGLIRINVASATDLEDLPGVGPVLAERIVAHRDSVGSFGTVEDLLDVPGIGEAKLAALRDLVLVP